MGRIRGHLEGAGRVATGSRLAFGAVLMVLLATCAAVPEGGEVVLAGPATGADAVERLSAFDVDVRVPEGEEPDEPEPNAAAPDGHEPSAAAADEQPDDVPVDASGDDEPASEPAAGADETSSREGNELDLPSDTAETAPDLGEVIAARPARMVVPHIGVDNPVVPVGLHPDVSLVVPDEAHVAGWYSGFSRPGQTGRPAVIAGHNVWGGRIGVFYRLHQLVPGDILEIRGEDDSTVRFEVERIEQHPKDAFPTNRVYDATDRADLRVITCGGLFDRSRGSHVDNIIVFAVLVD